MPRLDVDTVFLLAVVAVMIFAFSIALYPWAVSLLLSRPLVARTTTLSRGLALRVLLKAGSTLEFALVAIIFLVFSGRALLQRITIVAREPLRVLREIRRERARRPLVWLTYAELFRCRICPKCSRENTLKNSSEHQLLPTDVLGCVRCGFTIHLHKAVDFSIKDLAERRLAVEETNQGHRLVHV